jgi:OmpA-OmpF porin, OOP family
MHAIRAAFVASLTALLAACSTVDLDAMSGMEPQGSPFAQALYAKYRDLALFEKDEYDWADANHYGAKAVVAGGGDEIGPDDPSSRDLGPDVLPEIEAQHSRLVAMLSTEARTLAPDAMAEAQTMFDCWMEQQEEGHQALHIQRCRSGFIYAMVELTAALEAAARTEPVAEPEASIPEPMPAKAIVYFDFDSAALSDEAMAILDAAAPGIASYTSLEVAGHADRAGDDAYNVRLSERRAQAVADYLSAAGLAASSMHLEAYGETVPLKATDDGVAEPANRRVEIEAKP